MEIGLIKERIKGHRYYQFGGGGWWVFAITPSIWQFGHTVHGGYRHLFVGPFILSRATGNYARILKRKE